MAQKPRFHKRDDSPRGRSSGASGQYWIYGWHAVNAALANPDRMVARIAVSQQGETRLRLPRKLPAPEVMDPRGMDQLLGTGAVHQGIAALVSPLEPWVIEDILHLKEPSGPLLILDQVSDPHNVGAVLRSAAAFDACGIVVPKDNRAPETAAMAKTASGALDIVRLIQVTNLAAALRDLREAGWWILGLDGEVTAMLNEVKLDKKTALVLGAEGKGMRRLTAEGCDQLVKLPMSAHMESLNVSNAAAIALYHCYTQGRR